MRKLFTTLLLTSFLLPLHAQRSTPTSTPAAPPRLIATAEKEEKPEKPKAEKPAQSRTFFQRMFGPRPTPTPTPAPVVKNRPKPKPKATVDETPTEAPKKVTPKETPKAPSTGEAPATTAKPKTGKGGKKPGATSTDAAALDDATKFKNAKARALEDAHIKELKSRADGELNEAEAQKALEGYNRALFQKIREIDPSVGDYAGKVEQALHRRLSAEKPKQ